MTANKRLTLLILPPFGYQPDKDAEPDSRTYLALANPDGSRYVRFDPLTGPRFEFTNQEQANTFVAAHDRCCLLIGAIVSGWGSAEAEINDTINQIKARPKASPPPAIVMPQTLIEHDPRKELSERVNFWRKLLDEIFNDEEKRRKRTEVLQTRLKKLVLLRHDLSHTQVTPHPATEPSKNELYIFCSDVSHKHFSGYGNNIPNNGRIYSATDLERYCSDFRSIYDEVCILNLEANRKLNGEAHWQVS